MHKKIIALSTSVICFFACVNGSALGDGNVNDFEYTTTDAGVVITAYVGDAGTVKVPSAIDGTAVVGIGDFAFYGATVTSVSLPDSIATIGESAFLRCRQLESVNIPSGVTRIEVGAFCSCSSLSSIDIPASVAYIEPGAFYDCGNVEAITVDDDNPSYTVDDGILYSKDMTTLVYYPMADTRYEYTVPDSVTRIAEYACYGSLFRIVNLPANLEKIDSAAFYKAKNLTGVNIPAKIERIEATTFAGCPMLNNVHFDNEDIIIDQYAF